MGIILEVILKKEAKKDNGKWNPEDLDSPCQELSNGGLGIVITLLVHWKIIFVGSDADAQSSCIYGALLSVWGETII